MTSRHSQLVRLAGLVFAVLAIAVGPASASDRPAASFYPKLGLQADGQRWQAIADMYQRQQGLKADGLRLQGIAQTYQQLANRPAASFYTPQALKAEGLRWEAMARAYSRSAPTPVVESSRGGSGFDWGAAFIGAASVLGFATIGVALGLATRRVRRTKVAV